MTELVTAKDSALQQSTMISTENTVRFEHHNKLPVRKSGTTRQMLTRIREPLTVPVFILNFGVRKTL